MANKCRTKETSAGDRGPDLECSDDIDDNVCAIIWSGQSVAHVHPEEWLEIPFASLSIPLKILLPICKATHVELQIRWDDGQPEDPTDLAMRPTCPLDVGHIRRADRGNY